jgi:hypothetical protein
MIRIPAVRRFCVIVTNLPPPVPRKAILNSEFISKYSGDYAIFALRISLLHITKKRF